jgi:ABC-type transport system involved in multi-copper enzyme maturation permease subunit
MKLWEVIRQTVLNNLYDHRLVVLYALGVLLMGVAAFNSVTDLRQAQDHYSKLKAVAWQKATLETVAVVRQPNSLAFMAEGQAKKVPAYLLVSPLFVDHPLEDVSKQSFVAGQVSLDWAFVIGYVFSLMTLLMSFDAIAGEQERGTLALLLSYDVSRGTVLVGKLCGIGLVLVPVFLVGALVNLMIVMTSGVVEFTPTTLAAIGCAVILTVMFIGAHAAMGLLASSLTAKASTALVVCLLFWVAEVVLVPSGAMLTSQFLAPLPDTKTYQTQLKTAQRRFYAKQPDVSSTMIDEVLDRPDLTDKQKEEKINEIQRNITQQQRAAYNELHEELIRVRESYLNQLARQLRLAEALSDVSPVSLFQNLLSSLAGTDFHDHQLFYQAANRYRQAFARWSEQVKRSITAQREIKVTRMSWAEIDQAFRSGVIQMAIEQRGYVLTIPNLSFKEVLLDRGTLPEFRYGGATLIQKLNVALWRSATLCLLAMGIFAAAFFVFAHYRVR